MGMFDFVFRTDTETGQAGLPVIFPFALQCDEFIKWDILHTYTKILTDTFDRCHGLPEAKEKFLWDSCVQTDTAEGLVTLLACAMYKKSDLFLVLKSDVLRIATPEEESKIRADYEKTGESKQGVFISFKNYLRTDILQVYAGFEYCILNSLNKTLNLSKAIQVKINELRASVSLNDSAIAKAQAKAIATALREGRDVMLDAKDVIDTAKPDTSSAEKAIAFLDSKRAFLLDFPLSYISGLQTPGIGSTGEADMRAVERGLKHYFVSIVRPVCLALFGVSLEFKSQDFREITTGLEVLKTFDLVSEELITLESKRLIIARVFNLPEKEVKELEKQDEKLAAEAEKNPPAPTPDPNNPKDQNQLGNGRQAN